VIGRTLAHYRITAAIGAGGMGEVYRASDTTLGRDVALKRLPEAFASDPERLARFEREARLLASLNHPNIAHVYGFEAAVLNDGSKARVLVMELVEGEDLAERLKRGPIPLDEALAIARQIAEALEEAHDKGIVHRDLKPANIKLAPDGKVKVLDFGLAKALAGDAAGGSTPELSQSPTLAHTGTAAGLILGTAAYMSPEQARGKAVDKKADIWAFGVVLWEMLTGRKLFEGETVSDVLAAVLKTVPELDLLPTGVPPRVRRLLGRCLQKDPKQRLHDIADARIELGEQEEVTRVAAGVAPPRGSAPLLPWAVAALAIAASAGWALFGSRQGASPPRALRVAVLPPTGTVSSGPIELSLDGRQLVFTAAGADGRARLYVRSLDSLELRALPGTEGAQAPFFSPDGRSVGFFAERKLKRIDLAGGPLFLVPASGGDSVPVTTLDASIQESTHRWPRFLPDGKHFLFMSRKTQPPGRLAVEVGSVDGRSRTRLAESSSGGAFAGGRIYFVREATLLTQAFDERTLAVSGEPVAVVEDVWRDASTDGLTAFSVAEDGTVAYRRGGLARSQLTWLDREGQRLGTVGPQAIIVGLSMSSDGRRALVAITDPARDLDGLFILDAATGMTTRVTFGSDNQTSGIYSPDGRSVVFARDSKGPFDLYRQEIGAPGDASPLVVSEVWKFPESWSRDGRFVSYTQSEPGKPRDIWILPMTGEARPFAFAQAPAEEWGAAFSPDGRFLAYVSDESGSPEVLVRAFPASPARWQVSTSGGTEPLWRGDGKELFYLDPERSLVAVPITLTAQGAEPGSGRPLFRMPGLRSQTQWVNNTYQVTADGERFLANVLIGQAESSPIVLQTGDRR